MTKQNLINHVVFVLDGSGSMGHLKDTVIKVTDNQIKHLAEISKQMDQETRVSVYVFDGKVENVIFDKDVLRLPSMKDLYFVRGSTALIDATYQGITELGQTFAKYGEHAYLVYVITDGYENASSKTGLDLHRLLKGLNDDWTVAAFVPDFNAKDTLQRFGFSKDNVVVWDTSIKGMEEVGRQIKTATVSYMQGRSQGVRSTKSLFSLDTSNLNTKEVKKNLAEVPLNKFKLLNVGSQVVEIKPFVESLYGTYNKGNAYYQLTKRETIGINKQIAIRSKKTKKVYTGQNARDMLGLPDQEVKVDPIAGDFDIFVQSTSINRKLMPNTQVLVFK